MPAFAPKLGFPTPACFPACLSLLWSYFCVKCWRYKATLTPSDGSTQDLTFWEVTPLVLSLGSHGTWLPPHHLPCHSLTYKATWSQLGGRVGRYWSFLLTCELFASQGLYLFCGLSSQHNTQRYSIRYCHYYSHVTGGETESSSISVTELVQQSWDLNPGSQSGSRIYTLNPKFVPSLK